MILLDGKKISEELKASLKKKARRSGARPGFAAVLIGSNGASELYVKRKGEMARELGFLFKLVRLKADASQRSVITALDKLSRDTSINGIILQVPLPPHLSLDEISHHIDPRKDIDCFHPDNLSKLFLHKPTVTPPTPESVLRLIRHACPSLSKSLVVVVGSGFFTRQIAAHLMNHEAAVMVVSSRNKRLADYTRRADILVSAVGKPGYLTADFIKKGTIIIDVGITKVGSRVMGDADFVSIAKKAYAATPVPGGVGPMTIAVLMENVLSVAKNSVDTTLKDSYSEVLNEGG